MKVDCRVCDLAPALARAARIVSTRTTFPLFSNVLLEAGLAGLQLTTTNPLLTVTSTLPATITDAGSTTVGARQLAEYVGLLPADLSAQFVLASNGTRLRASSGEHVANFPTLDPQDFPRVEHEVALPISVDGQTFANALEQVLFAAAPDDSRPVLSGVLVRFHGDTLTLAAADGFRLAERTLACPGGAEEDATWIVPSATCRELLHALHGGGVESCRLGVTLGRQLVFDLGAVRLVSRLIDGMFPDYPRILAEFAAQTLTTVDCDRAELLHVIKLATLFARGDSLKVWLVGEESALVVEATGAGTGWYDTRIAASAEPFEMCFNSRYLQDVLAHLNEERVSLTVALSKGIAVLRPVEDANTYTYILMATHGVRRQAPVDEAQHVVAAA